NPYDYRQPGRGGGGGGGRSTGRRSRAADRRGTGCAADRARSSRRREGEGGRLRAPRRGAASPPPSRRGPTRRAAPAAPTRRLPLRGERAGVPPVEGEHEIVGVRADAGMAAQAVAGAPGTELGEKGARRAGRCVVADRGREPGPGDRRKRRGEPRRELVERAAA